ncbi:MAG: hypothetical protein Q4E06_05030 [Lautropia sp.]|nr:hypothetical protein [Lautropia sp.]
MLSLTLLMILVLVAALAWWLTGLIISHASAWGLQDLPNHRSSHTLPTPRGGGAAVVIASLAGLTLVAAGLAWLPAGVPPLWPAPVAPGQAAGLGQDREALGLAASLAIPVLAAALVLAATGFLDDRKPLRVRDRLMAQALATGLLFWCAGGQGPASQNVLQTGVGLLWPLLGQAGTPAEAATAGQMLPMMLHHALLAVLATGCIWWINLFNFMDGIDGIAGSQALFMLLAGVLLRSLMLPLHGEAGPVWQVPVGGLLLASPFTHPLSLLSLVVAAAVAGFLVHNWAPASIFMGDAGSLFLGFVILAVAALDLGLAVHAGHQLAADPAPLPSARMVLPLWTWLILGAAFITDATVTLLRRLFRGENPGTPHRSHAYQRLSRYYASHHRATLVYCRINLFWLLPAAFLAVMYPDHAALIAAIAYLPLLLLAWRLGAGREESASRS